MSDSTIYGFIVQTSFLRPRSLNPLPSFKDEQTETQAKVKHGVFENQAQIHVYDPKSSDHPTVHLRQEQTVLLLCPFMSLSLPGQPVATKAPLHGKVSLPCGFAGGSLESEDAGNGCHRFHTDRASRQYG